MTAKPRRGKDRPVSTSTRVLAVSLSSKPSTTVATSETFIFPPSGVCKITISLKSSRESPRLRVVSCNVPVCDLIFPEDRLIEFFLIAFATSSKFRPYLLIAVSDNSIEISSFRYPIRFTTST